MGNRIQQAKVLKLRKQRRKHPHPLDIGGRVKVPRRITKDHIPEDALGLFDYRGHAKAYDPFLESLFPGVKPKDSVWSAEYTDPKQTYPDGTAIVHNAGEYNGRKFALAAADEAKLIELLETEEACDFITVRDKPKIGQRLTYVFNRRKTMFFFVEVNSIGEDSYIRVSKSYGEHDRDLFNIRHLNVSLISWREVMPLASLETVLPRRSGQSPS